jgi:hypothetical protein
MGAPFETEEGGNLSAPHRMSNFACIRGELECLRRTELSSIYEKKEAGTHVRVLGDELVRNVYLF